MPLTPVTSESLRELQAKLSKARKDLTKALNEHDKAAEAETLHRNTVELDFVLERNDRKYHGSNADKRKLELDEALSLDVDYQKLALEAEKLKRKKRELADALADVETQLKIDLNVFEDERHRANRTILADLLKLPAPTTTGTATEPVAPFPITPPAVAVATDTARESVTGSFLDDLG